MLKRLGERVRNSVGAAGLTILLLGVLPAVGLLLPAKPASASASQTCRSVEVPGYRLHVTVEGKAKCRPGRRLARQFFLRKGFTKHGGPAQFQIYYTSPRWPGWRCGTGTAGGGCTKRRPFRRVTYRAELNLGKRCADTRWALYVHAKNMPCKQARRIANYWETRGRGHCPNGWRFRRLGKSPIQAPGGSLLSCSRGRARATWVEGEPNA